MERQEALRALPQVDQVVREIPELAALAPGVARWIARREIEAARARIRDDLEPGDVRAAIGAVVEHLTARRVRRVINATGVVLHTNLGRAPLSDEARAAVLEAMGAAAVEFDVGAGERARRAPVAATLAAALCDAEDALVVNNNAGALLLALGTLARGREVVVGRGELIEIGGEFRLPDVMEASGALLREVGTTNRTHLRDYEAALTERTAMILKVHPSNFRIVGFTTSPEVHELAAVARGAGIPLIYDVGSGVLAPREGIFEDEPDATSALAAGADLICFSGDKLLGGPQAGIIAGRADLIERCRRNPIARAVRPDKLTLAAMEATLWAHARGSAGSIPTERMLAEPAEHVEGRARTLAEGLPNATVVRGRSVTGGGSVPGSSIPTALLRIEVAKPHLAARALRANDPPIVARVERDALVADLRTVDPADDDVIRTALAMLARNL
jgi:L-seryl-tRNA(Ser) seleniumtransferase